MYVYQITTMYTLNILQFYLLIILQYNKCLKCERYFNKKVYSNLCSIYALILRTETKPDSLEQDHWQDIG